MYTPLFTSGCTIGFLLNRRQICDEVECWLCRRFVVDIFDFVANTFNFFADFSPVCQKSTVAGCFDVVDRVAVYVVAKVEHVPLGGLCRKWVIFVARMSNVISTLSPVCRQSDTVDFIDFRQSRPCRIWLCHQCVPGFIAYSMLNLFRLTAYVSNYFVICY